MSYVPPHRRNVPVFGALGHGRMPAKTEKTEQQRKQEHREQFPCLRDTEGQTVLPSKTKQPSISWKNITFEEEVVPAPEIVIQDGWINLGESYSVNHETTDAMLYQAAEKMLANYRRYYLERGLNIPLWVDDNPYNNFEDFDRQIPYDDDRYTESESSSEGEAFEYDSDSM
jgi:hypothetical protein